MVYDAAACAANGPTSTSCIEPGDTAYMLICTSLVWLMTPGLAFFYGGLVREKNFLNTLYMNIAAIGTSSLSLLLVSRLSLAMTPRGAQAHVFVSGCRRGDDPVRVVWLLVRLQLVLAGLWRRRLGRSSVRARQTATLWSCFSESLLLLLTPTSRDLGRGPNPDYATTIPHDIYSFFQLTFAVRLSPLHGT
jgi:ammonia channel protein AmtB